MKSERSETATLGKRGCQLAAARPRAVGGKGSHDYNADPAASLAPSFASEVKGIPLMDPAIAFYGKSRGLGQGTRDILEAG